MANPLGVAVPLYGFAYYGYILTILTMRFLLGSSGDANVFPCVGFKVP